MKQPTILLIASLALAPLAPRHAAAASTAVPVAEPASTTMTETCAEGAVNGLITVTIAAATALAAEVALPSYPVLYGTGVSVGCAVRIMGERLKTYGLILWRAGS